MKKYIYTLASVTKFMDLVQVPIDSNSLQGQVVSRLNERLNLYRHSNSGLSTCCWELF